MENWMMLKQKEIETIKPRKYMLNLSDADVKRLAIRAGNYNLTVAELLENFIGDLVGGTYSNGSDERDYADCWAERCGFSFEPKKNLITFFCDSWNGNVAYLIELLENIECVKSWIKHTEENIANPDKSGWEKSVTCYDDKEERTYKDVDEFLAVEKECLDSYEEDLRDFESGLKDLQDDFKEYMHGEAYAWEEEVKKAMKWYQENIEEKLEKV